MVPAWWEPELMGLVEAWARGCDWTDLIANTSLDEGCGAHHAQDG